MARTYRNRNSVPPGWTVRDDGDPYWNGWDAYGRETFGNPSRRAWRFAVPRYRRNRYTCERKSYRKAHNRQYRARCTDLIRHEKWEDIPVWTRTGGWLTW